jgi:small subunit ribosomal protein S4
MSKRIQAKHKLDRRMGQNIWGRPKSPVNRREYGPGQHGQRRKGKMSDFGTQLRAKQKLKGYYANITEKQFRRYYAEAIRLRGDSRSSFRPRSRRVSSSTTATSRSTVSASTSPATS